MNRAIPAQTSARNASKHSGMERMHSHKDTFKYSTHTDVQCTRTKARRTAMHTFFVRNSTPPCGHTQVQIGLSLQNDRDNATAKAHMLLL